MDGYQNLMTAQLVEARARKAYLDADAHVTAWADAQIELRSRRVRTLLMLAVVALIIIAGYGWLLATLLAMLAWIFRGKHATVGMLVRRSRRDIERIHRYRTGSRKDLAARYNRRARAGELYEDALVLLWQAEEGQPLGQVYPLAQLDDDGWRQVMAGV